MTAKAVADHFKAYEDSLNWVDALEIRSLPDCSEATETAREAPPRAGVRRGVWGLWLQGMRQRFVRPAAPGPKASWCPAF